MQVNSKGVAARVTHGVAVETWAKTRSKTWTQKLAPKFDPCNFYPCISTPLPIRVKHHASLVYFSLLGLLVGLPAPSPEPLLTLLRAKIEVKVTRPQVALRLSNSRAIEAPVYTAVSRAKIGGAPAAVSNVKSSNVTLKPAEGGGRVRSQIREVLLSFAREIS